MFSSLETHGRRLASGLVSGLLLSLALAAAPGMAKDFSGVGRSATPAEVAAWDIDVRPDFKGLPVGSGTVKSGQQVWDGKCASCHGSFGESNEVFTPVIGGTTAEDIRTGRVASLTSGKQPQRTTMMKLATVSTLWDYINRAMPWTAPKTLTTEEVYAVTAYILNMAEIVPDDFTLSDKNIAQVQARMPNRQGMTTQHGLREVKARPDVNNTACMKDCGPEPKIVSWLPESARDAHGNLAAQSRVFGGLRGIETLKTAAGPGQTHVAAGSATSVTASTPAAGAPPAPAPSAAVAATSAAPKQASSGASADAAALAQRNACMACHAVDKKLIGPGFGEIAARYQGKADAPAKLAASIRKGSSGVWGPIGMPPHAQLKDEEIGTMVRWILTGGK